MESYSSPRSRPMDLRRRNGVLAACDPCRKRKISCDHRKPTCARCERRGQSSRCIYHPTRLGPDGPLHSKGMQKTPLAPRPSVDFDLRLQRVKTILQQLKHFDRLDALIRGYMGSQGPIVPGVILIAILDAIRGSTSLQEARNESASDGTLLASAAQETIAASSRAVDIRDATTVSSFCTSLCGEHVRLEALGLIYSVAARACKFASRKGDSHDEDFISNLYSSSLECRTLARTVAPMNDALVWLAYENVVLTTYMHGDSSDLAWQRLDYLCGDLLALGVQRESFNTANTPPFLSELRRRLFHRTYGIDVYLSAAVDRPPRISKRHANCPLPLDLTDEEVCRDDLSLLSNTLVNEDGWSLSGQTNTSTWIRTRSLFSSVREEVVECSILPPNTETQTRLRALSLRSNEVWNTLPPHVRNTPTQYTRNSVIFLMLIWTRLKFLQCEMQIHAILMQQGESEWAWEPSLRVAAETMAHVLTVGGAQDHATMIMLDFPDIIVGFGLASAGIVARALQDLASDRVRRQFPTGLSRATLIRHLLTFISHLENLSTETYHSANTAFSNAARTLSRAVDEVLDPNRPTVTDAATAIPQRQLSGPDNSSTEPTSVDQHVSASPVLFSTEPLDELELSTWLNGVEWTGVAENWIDF